MYRYYNIHRHKLKPATLTEDYVRTQSKDVANVHKPSNFESKQEWKRNFSDVGGSSLLQLQQPEALPTAESPNLHIIDFWHYGTTQFSQ